MRTEGMATDWSGMQSRRAAMALHAVWARCASRHGPRGPEWRAGALAAVCMASAALAPAPAAASAALVSYVSPAQLFPVEGEAFQSRVDGRTVAYAPLPAYDRPRGKRVGEVRIADSACFHQGRIGQCADELRWELVGTDGARQELRAEEYSYATLALPSYRRSVVDAGGVWSRLATGTGEFWVRTPAAEVFAYERLATYLGRFDRWCDGRGRCRPVGRAMAAAVRRFEARSGDDLPGGAYQIVGRVRRGGVHYYRVELAPVRPGQSRGGLPRSGLVPVHNRDGSHTGAFYPRGC